MRNLNQLKVDIDRMRYSTDMGELRKRLSKILKDLTDGAQAEIAIDDALDPTSTNPVENRAIAAALQTISSAIQYIKGSATDLDTLNTMQSLGVYEYIGNGWKGLVSVSFDAQGNVSQIALSSSTPSYNGDTLTWISGQPCMMKRTYTNGAWSQWEEVGKKPDSALSSTSENAVQNKVINQALGTKVAGASYTDGNLVLYSDSYKTTEIERIRLGLDRIIDFEIDETTGCLNYTEQNVGDTMTPSIDENGYFKLTLE